MTHTLACALACNGSGGAGGKFIAWFFTSLIVLGCVIWLIRYIVGQVKKQPIMSPWAASLMSGYAVTAYTAPVSAVTPSGIAVRWPRCCATGHQTPEQAVRHAGNVAARIAVHGR